MTKRILLTLLLTLALSAPAAAMDDTCQGDSLCERVVPEQANVPFDPGLE